MLSKLALRNVKRQVGNYLIYFFTVSLTVSMLFAISNIIFSKNLDYFIAENRQMKGLLVGVVVLISAIVAFVLSYATSFMLRLRKREFGTYLTLGMTRKNILRIFVTETTLIGIMALALGLGLGLFIYQGLSALMMNLLEMQFSLAAYSPKGLALTIGLVIGIFLLASLTSAMYLKKVSIYDLIHGDKKVEKSVKHPVLWFLAAATSFVVLIGSLFVFEEQIEKMMRNEALANGMMISLLVFLIAIIFFHISFAKSIVYALLHQKKLCSRSTNTFVLRQLSGTLSTNAVMLGFLAFLLAFAVIGSNVAFVQKASQEEQLNMQVPWDIMYSDSQNEYLFGEGAGNVISAEQAEAAIEKYKKIESKHSYSLYTDGENNFYSTTAWSGEGYEMLTDSFLKQSDFNALITPFGYEAIDLKDEYMIIGNVPGIQFIDFSDVVYERAGKQYHFNSLSTQYPIFTWVFFYVVVPDEAVDGMTPEIAYTVYDIEDGSYDAAALRKELTYTYTVPEYGAAERSDYTLKEDERQQANGVNAVLVIGALFAAVIFLFMAMAILALKTLSTLSDDKQRYAILRRLGVGDREQSKTLFRQTFSFFTLPFVIPLLISIPTASICQKIMEFANMATLVQQIPVIAAVTAAVMIIVYLLYYTATYLIAKRAIIQKQ